MQAFASIHTAVPVSQCDHEGIYRGYRRVLVECQIGAPFLRVVFPEIEEDTDQVMTHIAVGMEEEGEGEIFMTLPVMPHIPLKRMQAGNALNVIIMYPETLPEAARVVHQLVSLGEMRANDLEPRFFELTNEALQAHGIPILTVTRSATAKWIGKMSNLPSFRDWQDETAATN